MISAVAMASPSQREGERRRGGAKPFRCRRADRRRARWEPASDPLQRRCGPMRLRALRPSNGPPGARLLRMVGLLHVHPCLDIAAVSPSSRKRVPDPPPPRSSTSGPPQTLAVVEATEHIIIIDVGAVRRLSPPLRRRCSSTEEHDGLIDEMRSQVVQNADADTWAWIVHPRPVRD